MVSWTRSSASVVLLVFFAIGRREALIVGAAVLLTLAVLLAKIGIEIPVVSGREFLVLLIAQILLIFGCTMRGL